MGQKGQQGYHIVSGCGRNVEYMWGNEEIEQGTGGYRYAAHV